MTKPLKEIWDNANVKESFPVLGVGIAAGQVWKGYGIVGPLRGAQAGVTGGTQAHRVGDAVAASVILGPVGLLAGLSTRTKAAAIVVLANGRTIEHTLDGNGAVWRAQQEAARFNARAQAA